MTALTTNPAVQALAWALVHFLWQGAAIGVLVLLWLRLRRPSAQARYAAGILALAALFAAPAGTFLWLAMPAAVDPVAVTMAMEPAEWAVPVTDLAPPYAASAPPAAANHASTEPRIGIREAAAVAIVAVWAAGVLLLALRLAGGWILARRLVARASTPAPPEVRALADRLAIHLGLTRAIRIVESSAVSVPVLVGWLKPVVLLPVCALSGLSTEQIEALIAHELAHVRRHDYLVNILQSIVETLLFYHPAVWLISSEVREAREHCCDDLAIGVCDRVVYVTALADLANISHPPRIALAASGGSLLRRVQRLLGQPSGNSGPGAAWLGVLSLALVLGGVMPSAVDSAARPEPAITGAVAEGQRESDDGEVTSDRDSAGVAGSVPGGIAGGIPTLASPVSQVGPEQEEPLRQSEEARRLRQTEADYQAFQRRAEEGQRALAARLAELEWQAAIRVSRQEPSGIAPLDATQRTIALQARAARALAEVNAARSELERSRELFDVGVLSPSELREHEARVAAAERDLASVAVEIEVTANEAATRAAIDSRRAHMQSEARIAQARSELMAAGQRLALVRERVEVGVAGREELIEAEARVMAAQRRLDTASVELQLAQEEAALRQRRIDVLTALEMQVQDVLDAILLPGSTPRVDAAPVTDPAARIRVGDVLSIEIDGEPDLPPTYAVDTGGTIRLPLVGSVEVEGLTAQQARDAVVAALAQRELAEGKPVTVTLRRPSVSLP